MADGVSGRLGKVSLSVTWGYELEGGPGCLFFQEPDIASDQR